MIRAIGRKKFLLLGFGLITTTVAGTFLGEFISENVIQNRLSPAVVFDLFLLGLAILCGGLVLLGVVAFDNRRIPPTGLDLESWRLVEALDNSQNWEQLSRAIFTFAASSFHLTMGILAVYRTSLERFVQVAEWRPQLLALEGGASAPSEQACVDCILKPGGTATGILPCQHAVKQSYSYCFPLVINGKQVARLLFFTPTGQAPSMSQLKRLIKVGPEIAAAVIQMATASFPIDLQVEGETLQKSVEAERSQLAKDLHDTLGQDLAYLRLKLDQLANTDLESDQDDTKLDLQRMLTVADAACNRLRQKISAIEPVRSFDLPGAVDELARLVGERNDFRVLTATRGVTHPLGQDLQKQIMFIVREAMNNVEKHAHAKNVTITLDWQPNLLTVTIDDDGIGFTAEASHKRHHYGLEIMRERAEAIHGDVVFTSAYSQGTEVTLSLPLESAFIHQPQLSRQLQSKI
jgi:signal transduction histidine kinase